MPQRADLDLTWSPVADDEFYLLLTSGPKAIVCRIQDEGAFTVKKSLLESLPQGRGTLAFVRRNELRFDTAFSAEGKAWPGRIRFELRRVYPIELQ